MKTLPNIILASKSPRRKKLLRKAGYKFNVFICNTSEESKEKDPHKLTRLLSKRKAQAVSKEFADNTIVAADTMVFMDNMLFGKPKDFEEAVNMLLSFSGKTHKIVTGITIIHNNNIITESDEALIKLRKLSRKEIIKFIKSTNPYDKAGGYSVENLPKDFIEKIKGEMSTILGLPLHIVNKHLEFLKVKGRSPKKRKTKIAENIILETK
jgi:septum formation protein